MVEKFLDVVIKFFDYKIKKFEYKTQKEKNHATKLLILLAVISMTAKFLNLF